MGDRVERLLEVHKAHIEWLLVLACLVHQYSEIRDLVSRPPSLSESRLFVCNFRVGLHSVEAVVPIFLFSFFPSFSWYTSSQHPFHLSPICAVSIKFSPVADRIHCRRGWYFRVIDLTTWKSCLKFPFEFAASNSTHMPSSCGCLSTRS